MREIKQKIFETSICFAFISSVFLITFSTQIWSQQGPRQLTREKVSTLPPKEKRWALVVGVDKYDDSGITPLRGASNDARALQSALRDFAGFPESQIILLTTDEPKERQPSRVNIMRRLSNLKGLVPADGLLLVSFSGHGIDRSGQAYLIPSDAAFTEDISLLEETALSVDRIRDQIRATGVGQVLILLDACRNDPVGGKADSSNPLTDAYLRGFRFEERNKDVQAFATLYATSIGTRAYEYAEKKQGYFTWAVVDGLSGKAGDAQTGEVTLRSLVAYVENTVPRQVALDLGPTKKQRPFAVVEGYRADSLVLAIGKEPITKGRVPDSPTQTPPSAGETAFWETIKNSNECQDFEAFLKAYPNSTYAITARFRSGKLCNTSDPENIVKKTEIQPTTPTESEPISSPTKYGQQQKIWIGMILKNDFQQVISQTTKEVEQDTRNLFAYRMRAVAYFMSNDGEKGRKDSLMLLDLTSSPSSAVDHETRCYAYFSLLKLDEAMGECDKAITKEPTSPMGFATRGYVFQGKRDFDKAIRDFGRAIELDPDFRWLHSEIGGAYYSKKNLELSLIEFSKAISAYPENEDFLIRRSLVYYDRKESDKAIADLSKVIDLNSRNGVAYFNRGLSYNNLQKYDQAIADFTRALEIEPLDFRSYFNRALSFAKKLEYKDAVADLTKAIQINPDVHMFFTNRGDYYFWTSNYAAAMRDYDEAIRLEPRDAKAYFGRGRVLQRQSEYTKAIDAYTVAVEIDDTYLQAYIERGFMYYIKSKYDLAFADFAKAINLDPNYADPYNRRGLIYLWKREFDRAITDFDKAIKLAPEFGWAYGNRCEAFNGKKDFDRAIADCTQALKFDPKVSTPYRERAKAFEGKGNRAAAAADRQKAEDLEKEFKKSAQ